MVIAVATTLAACSPSSRDSASAAAPPPPPDAETPARTTTDTPACTLVADASATLGQPVTPDHHTSPNDVVDCQWKSADGRLCGSLTVFGPGYNPLAADAKTNYAAMTQSMGAFGPLQDVAGIGEEAKAVDGGMFGAQLAFHKGAHSVLVASACKSGADAAPALAQRLAAEVASKL
jgi:hypothetical protein